MGRVGHCPATVHCSNSQSLEYEKMSHPVSVQDGCRKVESMWGERKDDLCSFEAPALWVLDIKHKRGPSGLQVILRGM